MTVGRVGNRAIPGPGGEIPAVHIYTPVGEGPFPALLYLHGGGWTVGDLDTADVLCRQITNEVNAVVVSVDYRRPRTMWQSAAIVPGLI